MKIFYIRLIFKIWAIAGFMAVSLPSCQKFEGEIVYKIRKGTHHCTPRLMQGTGIMLDFEFFTHPSWKYDADYVNGWSKLVGLGYLDHHENSARIGWRSEADSISICGYFYRNGERIIKELKKLPFGEWNTGSIIFFNGTYTITVNDKSVSLSGFVPDSQYVKNPFFGGSKPAPHDMYFPFRNVYSMTH